MKRYEIRMFAAAAATLLGSLAALPAAHAAIVISAAGQAYAQNFDTLTTSTTAVTWTNDSTLAGWSLFAAPAPGTAITSYLGGTGSVNTGSFYSFGTAASDRALGGVGSGGAYFGSPASNAVGGWIAASFTNTSGSALDGFAVNFDGEQWRNGGNTSAQSMVLQYGFGASFGAVGTWTTPGPLFDWASTVNTATAAAVDGNVAGKVAGRGGSIITNWNAGDTLWLRWIENNDVGNDHGLAIDNFSLTAGQSVSAVPLPAALPLLAAGMGLFGWIGRRRESLRRS